MSDYDPDVPKKKCMYRCPDCQTKWHYWLPVDERKLRRWCKGGCKQLVSPYATEKKVSSEHKVRVTKPKTYW